MGRITPTARGRPAGLLLLLSALACGEGPTGPRAEDFPDEPAPDPRPEVVAFMDVHVVPMDGDRVLRGQTVLVRGDRIEQMGPTDQVEVPEDAFRIEGQGRYLAPGLADMHVHLSSRTFAFLRNDFMLWLANGVTTLRVMWGGRGSLAERERIASGEVLGPSLLVASPGMDGPGGPWSTPPVRSAEEARARVADHAADGYDFLKVYNDLDSDVYDAIVAEAAVQRVPVVGHVPWRVGIERVQDAGQRTLEHFIGVKLRASAPFNGGTLDLATVRSLLARSAAAGVWHTPTITVDVLSDDRVVEIRASPELGLVSPGMRDFFGEGFYHGLPPGIAEREEQNHWTMTREVRDAGGGLLVGTDAGFGWIIPGFSIHDELRHFRQAGLSTFAALEAATSGAARSAGQEAEFGRVATGLRADLVLLAANPLADLAALQEVSGVMVRGRWLSRGVLAQTLADIRTGYGTGAATPR